MRHLSVVLGILAALCLMIPEPRRSEIAARVARSDSWAALWGLRSRIFPLLAGASLVAIADGAALIWLSPLLLRQYGESASRAGPIVALVIFGGGVSGPLIGGIIADWTQRRGGARWTMKAVALLASLSAVAGLFPLVPIIAGSVALMLIFIALGAAINVIVTTLLTIILPNELRGRCLAALWALAAIFGLGLAPLTVSFLSTTLQPPMSLGHALSLVTVLTGLIGAAAFLRGVRALGDES
jgi:MFS family permease